MKTHDFRAKYSHIPVAREGIPYILGAMFVTLVTAILGHVLLTWILLIFTLLVGHFFRDPDRITMADERNVVSSADGRVIAVKRVDGHQFSDRPCMKISIFMSVFDVHVNRIPLSGTVREVMHKNGRFKAANFAEASIVNEQNWTWIQSDSGVDIVMTQVAGLLARRIVCWPRPGDRVTQGERFGMIRFGSRMDIYVPEDSEILVSQGRQVYGGETVLCRLK